MESDADAWRRELADAASDPATATLGITQLCVARLGVSGGGVSVATADSRAIVCATDERAERVEDLQFTLGVGPCMDAAASGVAVLVPDLPATAATDAARWPGFLEGAEQAGVRALFALPLRIGAIRIGALDLYRTEAGPLDGSDLRSAYAASDAIGAVLVGAQGTPAGDQQMAWAGLAYRMHVHQATGMVQAQLDVPTADALLALRARAFAEGRTLADVARDVVDRRLRFDKENAG